MNTLMRWLIVMLIPLFGLAVTSCGGDEDEPASGGKYKGPYTFGKTQNFPKKWMVKSIKTKYDTFTYEYDSINRPVYSEHWFKYTYEGNTCTVSSEEGDPFKGYFDGNKLLKAVWRSYAVTNVTYEGNRLVKGSNNLRLTWDSNGNITRAHESEWSWSQDVDFTYTEISNKTNIDFNAWLNNTLGESWCDDGSECFTIFGWTGVRTTNLIATALSTEKEDGHSREDLREYSYVLDELGRPITIYEKYTSPYGTSKYEYEIEYVED